MNRRNNGRLLAGLILLVVGAAGLTYGIVSYNQAHAALKNALQRLMTGGSNAETQALAILIAGAAVAIVGVVLLALPRKR